MSKACLVLVAAGFFVATCVAPVQAEPWIVEKGQPRAEIVIAEHPARTVRLAAADLQEYVQKMSGARLPIVTQPSGNAIKLYVGRSPDTDRLGITAEGLKYGAYRLVSGDDWMVFLGDDTEFVPREPWPRSNASIASGELQKAWEAVAGGPWGVPNTTMWKDRHKYRPPSVCLTRRPSPVRMSILKYGPTTSEVLTTPFAGFCTSWVSGGCCRANWARLYRRWIPSLYRKSTKQSNPTSRFGDSVFTDHGSGRSGP